MKIAIVSPYSWAYPGGVNNHIEGLARQMAVRGHEVVVIAPDEGTAVDGARFISAGRSLALRANGSIAHVAVAPGTRRRVCQALLSESFDVAHVHEPLVPMVSTSAVRAARCKVGGTFHAGRESASIAYRLGSALFRRRIERLDFRIAVSEPARLTASRYMPGEYEIVPNGVDMSRFNPRTDVAKSRGGDREILFIGRNEPRKGLDTLLEAFPLICDEVPTCRLSVIGAGFTSEGVRRSLPHGLRDRVTVLGYVNNEELQAHYASSDIFCSPAHGGESFGIVLIESMASGTPVVASDIPGYSEVVKQAPGGLLFKNGDSRDLARVTVNILQDDALRAKLREAGLEGVRQFSWERLAERLERIYSA
ncbi:MAG: hypothetical protein CVT63_00760 [Candidatus Anoxymicrobium japonicum]|uniref:Phosphatidylinositol alpha-mannosyltransferase n=1 Tax=Candidatus Anoxymicrobium japonicum TaxID=2013648 RepID=A0A2N3G819_9ACTN|nr:MAG: hypothetical protein CVT63_00760 [Candidatus Anoxymicrobium japonicum]